MVLLDSAAARLVKIGLFDHTCCCLWLTGCQLEAMAEAGSKFRWLSLTLPSPSQVPPITPWISAGRPLEVM